MPLVDMPLSRLKEYKGISPKPVDFDEYWDDALSEMNAVDSNVTLTPAKFQSPFADCFDMYFTGVRGARIYAKYARPKNCSGKAPAVFFFHGYSGSSGDWTNLLPYVASGFCVASLDCRGQGGKSQDIGGVLGDTMIGHIVMGLDSGKENLLFRHIFLDTAQLVKIVKSFPEVDKDKLAAKGGSQGGALTIVCGALSPELKLLCPAYPFLSDYRRVWEMDLAKSAYEGIKSYFRYFDPRHERADEIFNTLGYIDIHNLAPRIKGKVVLATGLMDTVCPPSTQFAIYNNLTCDKEQVIYPDFGHESLPKWAEIEYSHIVNFFN